MSGTLTRASLKKRVAECTTLSVAEAEQMSARVLELVGDALGRGESVKLTGFGTLEIRSRGARQGRNPKTGRPYPVGARKVVVFTPSARLKQKLEALIETREPGGGYSPARPQPAMSAMVREK